MHISRDCDIGMCTEVMAPVTGLAAGTRSHVRWGAAARQERDEYHLASNPNPIPSPTRTQPRGHLYIYIHM